MMHFKTNQLKFSMKLLLDKNIVLVEYPGLEPQLFMPVLVDNSIVLQNIIFDNSAPVSHRIRPKLPVLKVEAPANVKMATHSYSSSVKMKHRHQSGNLPMANTLTPTRTDSYRWIRSGCDTTQKLTTLEDPPLPVLGPSLASSIADSKLGKRLSKSPPKIGAGEPSPFDNVRNIFYCNLKQASAPATLAPIQPKIADDNKMTTRKSRGHLSVRRLPRNVRTLCDT